MAINKNEIEKFFENSREIRNIAIGEKNELIKEEKKNSPSLNPRYIGIYLSTYYSKSINKNFQNDFLK